jgi:hypothetical protein
MHRGSKMQERESEPSHRRLDVEQVDLAELLAILRHRENDLEESLAGRSLMRDIVAAHLGCSMLEAENLVDTLIARGFAHLERDSEGRERWRLSMGT